MKTVGIIAEFNPFHNGHLYFMEEAKRISGADYCVVVMSGDFVQRGAPAMTNKYIRSRMALDNGADLVLELPVCYSCGSAEYFAEGAVALLDKLGVVDTLCFGSECGRIDFLLQAAGRVRQENEVFEARLRSNLRLGMDFAGARMAAFGSLEGVWTEGAAVEMMNMPNNILGIEYCKALLKRGSGITPLTLRRRGAGYSEMRLGKGAHCSAKALRQLLETEGDTARIAEFVPENVLVLLEYLKGGHQNIIREDDFSLLLYYKLLLETAAGYSGYLDVSADLSAKIKKHLPDFIGFHDFVCRLKSKDVAFSRLSRCLLHIMLQVTKADMERYLSEDGIFYARMLGFRKSAAALLKMIKKNTDVPLLSKLADAPALLGDTGRHMLARDIQAGHLYDSVFAAKYGILPIHEYRRKIIVI